MKKISSYIDDLKEKKGISSDYAIAKYLGMSKAAMSAIRNGGSIRDETAIKIADELEIDLSEILLAATTQRTHNERLRKAWEKISQRIGTAASIFLLIGLINAEKPNIINFTIYTLCEVAKINNLSISRSIRR